MHGTFKKVISGPAKVISSITCIENRFSLTLLVFDLKSNRVTSKSHETKT